MFYIRKIVSDDGKRVKRKIPFTDKDKEELMVHLHFSYIYCLWFWLNFIVLILHLLIPFLQLRTVVAENLPDDHSHHNIEKIFNVAGRWWLYSCISSTNFIFSICMCCRTNTSWCFVPILVSKPSEYAILKILTHEHEETWASAVRY